MAVVGGFVGGGLWVGPWHHSLKSICSCLSHVFGGRKKVMGYSSIVNKHLVFLLAGDGQ